jgi:hypothetical protein
MTQDDADTAENKLRSLTLPIMPDQAESDDINSVITLPALYIINLNRKILGKPSVSFKEVMTVNSKFSMKPTTLKEILCLNAQSLSMMKLLKITRLTHATDQAYSSGRVTATPLPDPMTGR